MEEIIDFRHLNINGSNINNGVSLEIQKFQKMVFLYNALENGWAIKKRKDKYIFAKNHEGKKEVFDEAYLSTFMKQNMNINNILS